jgi:hypothetical protein
MSNKGSEKAVRQCQGRSIRRILSQSAKEIFCIAFFQVARRNGGGFVSLSEGTLGADLEGAKVSWQDDERGANSLDVQCPELDNPGCRL